MQVHLFAKYNLDSPSDDRPIVTPIRRVQPIRGSSFSNTFDSRPVASFTPAFSRPTVFRNTVASAPGTNPCNPSPCGQYTTCSVSNAGIAMCRCIENYVPQGNTIEGCKPQCTV